MEEANYACVLPSDYLHILNCTVHFSSKCGIPAKSSNCKIINDDGLNGTFSLCRRLTANQFPAIIQNAYLKPTYKRPYFYINKSTSGGKMSVLLEGDSIMHPCKSDGDCIIPDWQRDINQIVNPCSAPDPNCQNGPIMEIRCGINSNLYPDVAYVDYLKRPKIINLT